MNLFKSVLRLMALAIIIQATLISAYAGEEKPSTTPTSGEVIILEYQGIINPVAAEYLGDNIAKINKQGTATLIVVMLDTPGGLDTSMRIIIKEIMASSIPVAIYVAPSGSRAASAGTFISMSGHIAAMAPGTTQGAASPVPSGGGEMSKTMEKKVKNDAAAYIRSLAKARGRNEEWAEKAVRKAVSVDEQQAVKQNITDFVAKDLESLLEKLEGWSVKTAGGKKVIRTQHAKRTFVPMTERQNFLNIISNPTVAYMLMMLGFYGLFFELQSPGVLLPGIVGAICLILGFYGMQSVPINYAGLLLLALAVIMFIAEAFVPTFGALTLGGVISMILGAVMLIDTPAEYMRVQLSVIIPFAVAIGLFSFFLLGWLYMFKGKKVGTGADGLIGETGTALSIMDPFGSIKVEGELWDGKSGAGKINKGDKLKILKKEGRVLIVEPAKEE